MKIFWKISAIVFAALSVVFVASYYRPVCSVNAHPNQEMSNSKIQAQNWEIDLDSDLVRYAKSNDRRAFVKWDNYFEVYERHLAKFRNTDVHLLEIGVENGGSLQMWKSYLGPSSQIFGVDINPKCKAVEEDRIKVFIGDQEDRRFLSQLKRDIPKIDIVIDDGGHTMGQQRTSFEELFPQLADKGVYIVEDLHTSYWSVYGGGVRKEGTFIEMAKGLVDDLNAWNSREAQFKITDMTKSLFSIHFYNSIAVFEKRKMFAARELESGKIRLD